MRVLLLSPYDAASHRMWRKGLVRYLAEAEFKVLTLPPRFFAWRSRGNPLSWAFSQRNVLEEAYDVVVATSMTDFAELKGIVPGLAGIPSVVYFHENQFEYPEQRERKEYQNYKLTNLYTALAADRVLFNSRYNMETFMEGAKGLLSVMPDHVPDGIVESVMSRAEVVPVPLEDGLFRPMRPREGPLNIVWNHRWEYDKAPERFFGALDLLIHSDIPFHLYVLGQRFRDLPPGFANARERFGNRVRAWGFVENEDDYRRILSTADLAVSTALHDFQGLAVLEAVASGCLPLVPDRLAYPEFIPERFRYPSFPEDERREIEALSGRLKELCCDPDKARKIKPPDVNHLTWKNLGPKYGEIIREVSGV